MNACGLRLARGTALGRLIRRLAPGLAGALVAGSLFAAGGPAVKPPFQLQFDRGSIDRAAPPPGSYGPAIRQPAQSVVCLLAVRHGRTSSNPAGGQASPRSAGAAAAPASPRSGAGRRAALGSGFLLTADGYILTTSHELDGVDEVKVRVAATGRDYPAAIVGRDAASDLAVLKIDVTGLRGATLGDSDQLEAGDLVLALGDAAGEGPVASHGIISALGRALPANSGGEVLIQTDDPVEPGDAGGPLLDARGRVIGVNTVTDNAAGLGLAIPINRARFVAEQLVANGRVLRGFLGVGLQELTDDLKAQFGASQGALIAEVAPDGPAAQAGLKNGDVIVRADGAPVVDTRRLQQAMSQLPPGGVVTFEVLRNGKSQAVRVKLGVRPGDAVATGGEDRDGGDNGVLDGVTVADLTPDVREALHLPPGLTGAVITEVAAESASASAGLRVGDVVTELNRRPVATADEAVHLSEVIKGPKVMVRLWRGGSSQYVVVDESAK